VTVVCGLLLGAGDFAGQKILPYPWADLANSSAVWAVAAFGIGLWVRSPWWRSAISAVRTPPQGVRVGLDRATRLPPFGVETARAATMTTSVVAAPG